jgi:hypothetical protein
VNLSLILTFALAAIFSASLTSCTPSALSAADLVGRSAARVLGWCENTPGANSSRLAQAKKAIEDEDLLTAAALLHQAVNELRESGKEPPADVAGSQMLLGALAAEAIQNGMRALSTTPSAGSPP